MGILGEIVEGLSVGYGEISGLFGDRYGALVNVFIFAVLIALYSVFTWKFYRSLSKKDLIGLNLSKYNKSTQAVASRFFLGILYLLEYIVILPFLIFFWFAVLALIILVLSEELLAQQIIVVSAAIVAAIRILSYYEEDLSRDLAKIFPFTILAIFIINPGFFEIERVIANLLQIPNFLSSIVLFLVLIVGLELILRIIDIFLRIFRGEPEESEEDS